MNDLSDISVSRRNLLIAGALSATTTAMPLRTAEAQSATAPPATTPPPSITKFTFQITDCP